MSMGPRGRFMLLLLATLGLVWAENRPSRPVWTWHWEQPSWSEKESLGHGSTVAFGEI